MTDSVKFIFRTLIKVPIFIFTAFFIFNIFAFFFIYFRMLGISYVVMQTAVENNYLPKSEAGTLIEYLGDTSSISMVEGVGIIISDDTTGVATDDQVEDFDGKKYACILVDNDGSFDSEIAKLSTYSGVGALKKQQYGRNVVCGVYCEYKIIWPLDYRYTGDRDAIMNGDGTYTYDDVHGYDGTRTTGRNNYLNAFSKIKIVITYKVPGLKYYPDLDINA